MQDDIDITAAACIASTRAQIEAEESVSDEAVPPKLLMLARRCGESTDYPVLAIVKNRSFKIEPDGPVDNVLLWHADRLEGKALTPPPRRYEHTAWCFVLDAHREDRSPCNAATVERWLAGEGYDSFAIGPNTVEVCRA